MHDVIKPMIYRRKRWRSGKLTVAQMWRDRLRVGSLKMSDVPLKTTDRFQAWAKLQKLVQEREYESIGLGPSVRLRESAAREGLWQVGDCGTERVGRAS